MSKAAENRTGGMVALVPADVERLAAPVRGALPRSDLHVTLKFLGEASDWSADDRERVDKIVGLLARPLPPIKVIGLKELGPEDGRCITVLMDRTEELLALRAAVDDGVQIVREVPDTYPEYLPHMTLAYQADTSARGYQAAFVHAQSLVGTVLTFPRMLVTFGASSTYYDL